MKRPLIALSARNQTATADNPIRSDNSSYFDYVCAGGGIPVIAFVRNEEEADVIAEKFDGLLITGGEDCDPSLYGEKNTFSEVIDADIERSDFLLCAAFEKANKPVMGICRGIQVIGVHHGASLIQDIPDEFHVQHAQNHLNPPLGRNDTCHNAVFVNGTRIGKLMGEIHPVNSYHHQALRFCPEGFTVSARSEDGMIEAIEKDHVLAVQWHPERLIHDPKHLSLMQSFIDECSSC